VSAFPRFAPHEADRPDERWARSWSSFRKDLETLYNKGYRAVNLSDYLNNTMPLPAGTSPVLFTFDDSFANQMKLVKGPDGQWQADPKSAVGIMLQFKKEHPDFGAAGTFYCNFTPVPFREPDNWKEKIQFLVDNGFEIGNHTQYHEDLSTLTDAQVQKTFATQVKLMQQALPNYDGDTMALPFGIWPKNHQLACSGSYDGTTYKHKAVLLVGADPNYAPLDKRLDVLALTRVQAIDSEFARWYPYLDKYRYISDGDPDTVTIPDDMQSYLKPDPTALGGKRLRTYKREG
jgi:peptidoglycan/xylan/chitin deacetylase (PgdA/CDA1 family)